MQTFQQKSKYYSASSMRDLAAAEGMAKRKTISLRALLNGPETRLHHVEHELNAGDVNATVLQVFLQSDGGWGYIGNVFDHGSVVGDDFTAVAAMAQAVPGSTLAWSMQGSVGAQTWNNWTQTGFNADIRDNWDAVLGGTVHYDLKQSSKISVSEVIGDILGGIVIVGFIIFLASSKNQQYSSSYDENGNLNGITGTGTWPN